MFSPAYPLGGPQTCLAWSASDALVCACQPEWWRRDPARPASALRRSAAASTIGQVRLQTFRKLPCRADRATNAPSTGLASRDRRLQSPSTRIAVARKRSPAEVVPPPRLHRTPQNPIARRLLPAGSCMGGYRTPAQLCSLGLLWPASDTLHHPGRSTLPAKCSEADIARADGFALTSIPIRLPPVINDMHIPTAQAAARLNPTAGLFLLPLVAAGG